jgi:transcription-repair coupling factor (superfamily II helicase)
VARLRGEPVEEEREIRISVPLERYLPDRYVADSEERMDIYRRLARMSSLDEVRGLRDELADRFGPPPSPAENMLRLVIIRIRALGSGIERIELDRTGRLGIWFVRDGEPARKSLAGIVTAFEGRLEFRTDPGLSLTIQPAPPPAHGVRPQPAAVRGSLEDLESLLNLLESCDI